VGLVSAVLLKPAEFFRFLHGTPSSSFAPVFALAQRSGQLIIDNGEK
jgi:hypothetical protein